MEQERKMKWQERDIRVIGMARGIVGEVMSCPNILERYSNC